MRMQTPQNVKELSRNQLVEWHSLDHMYMARVIEVDTKANRVRIRTLGLGGNRVLYKDKDGNVLEKRPKTAWVNPQDLRIASYDDDDAQYTSYTPRP